MIKTIAIVLVALVATVLAIAATRPDTFRVRRTATIAAPPEQIYALIHDFHAWSAWSPYEKLDPAMMRTHGGAAAGVGAVYAWESRGKAGVGRMEITDVSPAERVTIRLDFETPFRSSNTTEFTLEPRGAATRVTWAMHGPSPFVTRVFGLFFDMDRLIGGDFETGLANLRTLAERQPAGGDAVLSAR